MTFFFSCVILYIIFWKYKWNFSVKVLFVFWCISHNSSLFSVWWGRSAGFGALSFWNAGWCLRSLWRLLGRAWLTWSACNVGIDILGVLGRWRLAWLRICPGACCTTDLIHVCFCEAAINGNALLVDATVYSVCFCPHWGLVIFASTNRAVILIVLDLILALCDSHGWVDLARRMPRWLTSRLLSLVSIVVALCGQCDSLNSIKRHLNLVLVDGRSSSVRIWNHEGRKVVSFSSLISKAIVPSKAELPIGFLSSDLSLHRTSAQTLVTLS